MTPIEKVCSLTRMELVIEILMNSIKNAMTETEERASAILAALESREDVEILEPYRGSDHSDGMETYIQTFQRVRSDVHAHLQKAIHSRKPYSLTVLHNLPDAETDETHWIGVVVNTKEKEMSYFNTGAGVYGSHEDDYLRKVLQELVTTPGLLRTKQNDMYRVLREDDGRNTCQIDPGDTFCQTWSAYYTVHRVLDPTFGIKLRTFSQVATRYEKLARNFHVFQTFVRNLPEDVLYFIKRDYDESIRDEPDAPKLNTVQIKKILQWYFSPENEAIHMYRIGELVALPEVDESPRFVTDTLEDYTNQLETILGTPISRKRRRSVL